MPVPALITELTINAATNSPDGDTESVITTDNYFRAHAAFIAQLRDGKSEVTLSAASTTLGAIKLDNPGGTTRSLTQWNGTAYASFTLGLSAFQAPYFFTSLSACYFGIDAGGGNPGASFDTGDYMEYNRTSNRWRQVIGGAEKLAVDANAVSFLVVTTYQAAVGDINNITVKSDAPLDQKVWITTQTAMQKVSALQNDASNLSFNYDRITRNGTTLITRILNETSGRLLVGQGLTDDVVTALQTTSYSASNQPSLVVGSGGTYSVASNAGQVLDITSSTLKGGVFLTGANTRINVPVSGTYLLSAAVSFISGGAAGSAYVRILKNGVLYKFQAVLKVLSISEYYLPISLQIPMSTNDYISIEVVNQIAASSSVFLADAALTKIN